MWDISSYCVTEEKAIQSIKPAARDKPRTIAKKEFVPGIRISVAQATTGKQKKELQDEKEIKSEPPILLMSFRAHLMPVVSLDFVEHPLQLLVISASKDCSVRLWTHNGRYIGKSSSLIGNYKIIWIVRAFCLVYKCAFIALWSTKMAWQWGLTVSAQIVRIYSTPFVYRFSLS